VRIRAVLGGILGSVAVLVVGWQAGAAAAHEASVESSSGSGGSTSGTASGSGTLKDGTYTGTSEATQFGNVQVKVVVSGGKITDVIALQLTSMGGRSVQISNYAAPILRSEVIAAQSANVSTVSGATYTTDGYLSSVQSALDQAKT
jgi:uncharacterized protein with FMN-binding domain